MPNDHWFFTLISPHYSNEWWRDQELVYSTDLSSMCFISTRRNGLVYHRVHQVIAGKEFCQLCFANKLDQVIGISSRKQTSWTFVKTRNFFINRISWTFTEVRNFLRQLKVAASTVKNCGIDDSLESRHQRFVKIAASTTCWSRGIDNLLKLRHIDNIIV